MDLIPSQADVLAILRTTGALRSGHFEYTGEIHIDQHLETALAMRSWEKAKILSVGLSRLIRADVGLRTVLPELSIVAATISGLPVAYGLAEVLRPRKVYGVERDECSGTVRFPQFLRPEDGEKVLLVDDVMRSGRSLAEAAELLRAHRAEVLGIAVLIHQPDATAISFGRIPVHVLESLPRPRYFHYSTCPACRQGVPLEGRTYDFREAEAAGAA